MDERMLLDAQTGVATYARALRTAQQAISERANLICDRDDPGAPIPRSHTLKRRLNALNCGTRNLRADADRYILPDLFRLAQVYFDIWGRPLPVRLSGAAGIAHWSYPMPVVAVGWRNFYTVHDAIPLIAPSLTPIDTNRHRKLLRALAARASAFVTVSDTARREILDSVGGKSPPIVDCGQAISAEPARAAPPEELAPRSYWLVVGTVETRKNIPAIVEAHRRSRSDLPLVIVGPDGWGSAAIAPLFNDPRILRLPYLSADVLRATIAQARALIMVSYAEGFGLPIGEAMALGTPVITADRGAQAETAGDAALLVDPLDPTSIATAIRRLEDDDSLWAALTQRGRVRARDFVPARFAERLGACYASFT